MAADGSTALQVLAKHALALLASSEEERAALVAHAEANRGLVHDVLEEYDVSETGQLEEEEAKRLFEALARSLLEEAAAHGEGAAAAHAQGLLASDAEECDAGSPALCTTVAQMADHLRYEFCVRTKPVAGRDDVYRFRAISSKELKLWKAALPFNDAVAVVVPS